VTVAVCSSGLAAVVEEQLDGWSNPDLTFRDGSQEGFAPNVPEGRRP